MMQYSTIIAAYSDYEPYELDSMQTRLLTKLKAEDPLPAFEEMLSILKNEMFGSYKLINNHLIYDLHIRLRTQTHYEYVDHSGSTSKLEAQRIDAIRYRIEPLATMVNTVFSKLEAQQTFMVYNIYICNMHVDGYARRSLRLALRKVLTHINQVHS